MNSFINSILNKITKKDTIDHLQHNITHLVNKHKNLETITQKELDLRDGIIKDQNNLILALQKDLQNLEKQNNPSIERELTIKTRILAHYHQLIRQLFTEKRFKSNHLFDKKKQTIILDTCIILDPFNTRAEVPISHKHMELLKLLEYIEKFKKKLQPIVSDTLWSEISNQLQRTDLDFQNTGYGVTIFPVQELYGYFNECIKIKEDQEIKDIKQKLMSGLTPKENYDLSKSGEDNMHNDLLYLAIAKHYNSILITEDTGLLNIANNPEHNIKALTLYPPRKSRHSKDQSYKKNLSKFIT